MSFVKAEPPRPGKNVARDIASIRLFDNGNCMITLPQLFIGKYMVKPNLKGRFIVRWGVADKEGQVMIAPMPDGELPNSAPKDYPVIMLRCLKPAHAPPGKRPAKDCRLISFKDGGVLLQLPNWKD